MTNPPLHSHIPLPIGMPMFPLPKEPCVKNAENDYTIYVQYRCKYIRCLSWQSASFPPAEASLPTSYRGGIQCSIVSHVSQHKFLIYWIFFCPLRGKSRRTFAFVFGHIPALLLFKSSSENDLMYVPRTWRFRGYLLKREKLWCFPIPVFFLSLYCMARFAIIGMEEYNCFLIFCK